MSRFAFPASRAFCTIRWGGSVLTRRARPWFGAKARNPVLTPHGLANVCWRALAQGTAVNAIWPDIPFKAWHETCSALRLYCQIAGKYRLARTPWVNHSWHATLYVNSRGLTTSLIPD